MSFSSFEHVHPQYATPDLSILLQSGLAIALLFIGGIEALLGYFTLSYLLQNALIYGALFKLRKNEDYQPSYRAPAWWLMAVLAIATQLYLAYGTFIAYPTGGVLSAAIIIGSGLPIYFYFDSRLKKKSNN